MTWDDYFNLAQDYYNRHGDLAMPSTYWAQGVNLGAWVSRQRVCHLPDAPHPLSPRQIELLDALGMDWEIRRRDWESCFGYAERYFAEHGHLRVRPGKLADGFDLYQWLAKQRYRYATDHGGERTEEDLSARKQSGRLLTKEQIARLEAIGMVWDPGDAAWERSFALAERYFHEHGNLSVPRNYVVQGVNLSHWIWAQRQIQAGTSVNKERRLSDEQVRRLESIGMVWAPKAKGFRYYYDLAKKFYEAFGHTDFPAGSISIGDEPLPESGEQMRKWKSEQEQFLMSGGRTIAEDVGENPVKSGKQASTFQTRRKLLYEIGINPAGWETSWEKHFRRAEAYYREHGDLLVPFSYKTEDGVALGRWISKQRMKKKGTAKARLSEEQAERLEKIGMVWDLTSRL